MVAQITEEDLDEETTVTQMIAYDADENFYHLYSLCGYSDIYENDAISFYGVPLAFFQKIQLFLEKWRIGKYNKFGAIFYASHK